MDASARYIGLATGLLLMNTSSLTSLVIPLIPHLALRMLNGICTKHLALHRCESHLILTGLVVEQCQLGQVLREKLGKESLNHFCVFQFSIELSPFILLLRLFKLSLNLAS